MSQFHQNNYTLISCDNWYKSLIELFKIVFDSYFTGPLTDQL